MELAFQIVPTVNRVWREGLFSKRVGKGPQLEVVLGPSFPALDREPIARTIRSFALVLEPLN